MGGIGLAYEGRCLDIRIALIIVAFQVVGLVTAIHAIMTVRSSQGATAWAMALLVVPYVGLPMYWVFGRNKYVGYVKARRVRNEKIRHIVTDLQSYRREFTSTLEGPYTGLRTLEKFCQMPFTHGNRGKLLIDGEATFEAIFAAIDAAREYVLVQFYIVRDDVVGRQFRDLLCRKAEEGVRVYFLYDEIGCYGTMSRGFLNSFRAAGVDMRAFSTTRGIRHRFRINFRNHRKIVIADGRVALAGGHNLGDEYLGRDRDYGHWRDTHVQVEGPAVQCVQLAFLEDWFYVAQDVPDLSWKPESVVGSDMDVLTVPSSPADQFETCGLSYLHIINSARQRLWIATPYFVPDSKVIAALQVAAIRGVDVRLLVPFRPDNWLVYLSSCSFIQLVEPFGIPVYRYHPGFLHQKVMLADEFAFLGTANLDNRSFRLNFEIMLGVADPEFAAEVADMLIKDFESSTPITADELNRTPFWFRLGMKTARLLAPIL